jgi:hypothetical protein
VGSGRATHRAQGPPGACGRWILMSSACRMSDTEKEEGGASAGLRKKGKMGSKLF